MYLLKRCGKFKFDIAAGCKRTPKAELIQMDIVKKVRGSVQPLPQCFNLLFIMILTYKKIHLKYRIYPQIGRTRVLAAPQTFNGFHGKKKIVEVEYRDK